MPRSPKCSRVRPSFAIRAPLIPEPIIAPTAHGIVVRLARSGE